MTKFNKWLASPWVIGLGTTVFGSLLTIGYDIFKEKPILSTIGSILVSIWNFILGVLNFELRVWWLLLGSTISLVIVYALIRIGKTRNSHASKPQFLNYTQDSIQEWKWSWNWEKQYDGRYSIDNLHPICAKCGTPLVSSYRFSRFVCPRCKHNPPNSFPDIDAVKIIITDNANRGFFQQKIEA